jgi:hypothetical protein
MLGFASIVVPWSGTEERESIEFELLSFPEISFIGGVLIKTRDSKEYALRQMECVSTRVLP